MYNGYKNWQTWNVALWFGNDEGLYNKARRWARTDHSRDDVETFVRETLPDGTPDMGGKEEFDTVDWSAIAEAFYEF